MFIISSLKVDITVFLYILISCFTLTIFKILHSHFLIPDKAARENALSNRRTWINKSLETVFSIAICRQVGDKWQLKTLLLMIFYLC